MKFFKPVLVVLFLTLWLSATNHCLLENFSSAQEQCCVAEGAASDSDHRDCDNCSAVESVGFKFEQDNSFSFAHAAFFLPMLQGEQSSDQQSFVPIEISTQPQLPAAWQFVFRTALPVRAPSFVS